MVVRNGLGVGFALLLTSGTALAGPKTLTEALSLAYSTNPTLLTERATLRATDEGVPQALAGWRPTVVLQGAVGYSTGTYRQRSQGFDVAGNSLSTPTDVPNDRQTLTAQATVTQYLYRGGATRAATNRAENAVMSERARLIATEQQVFTNTVSAYVGVIQSQQLLQLQVNNEQVLQRQLQATNDRFRVGEITRTDVAQAEAALAGARATRESAGGNLQTARATYIQAVGELPDQLIEPQPLALPIRTEAEATNIAASNNPNVVAALFNQAAAKDAVDAAFAGLMPTVNAQATSYRNDNSAVVGQRTIGAQATLNLSVPVYQGGAEYSRIRQAKQQEQGARKTVDDQRRTAVAAAAQAYETLVAARATADSTRAQIRANQIALEGVEREAIVGSRTTLDVLNAQQALLNSRVTLVQNLAQLVIASYSLAASVGRLTAHDLQLNVPLYDETAYYTAVRDKLWGVNDAATDQPGR